MPTPAAEPIPDLPPPPPGWPRTDSPLRVAILGWARLSNQAREGSGYNLNASDLAAGLVLSGHRVFYLRSGMEYSITGPPRVRHHEWWRGVSCYDFVNSRNLSPASSNFRNMTAEMSSPEDTRVVLAWLKTIGAQVVHIHSLEGYSLDLIAAVRAAGLPVIVTPHNYWYVCPQVDLLHNELRVCDDYDGGRRCENCLEAPDPAKARRNRGTEQSVHRVLGPFVHGWFRQLYDYAKHRVKNGGPKEISTKNAAGERVLKTPPFDPAAAQGFDPGDEHHDGLIDHGLKLEAGEKIPDIGRAPIDQNERFLTSDVHLKVLNDYGRRRLAGIDALNHASLVTPPSKFLLEVLHAMGLKRELGRHVRLGQPHFDQLNRRARRSPYYTTRPWNPETSSRPLRFGFLGTTRNNKGLEVLARAIPRLDRDVRQRCHFMIRAAGWDWFFRKRLSPYPEVSFLGGYDPLMLVGTMDEFDVGVLPHIWFENSPLVLLEMLHAGKFVLASRLGGPPEWIVEPGTDTPGNGLLFAGGDAEGLASHITRLVRGEVAIPSAEEVHAVSVLRSYPDQIHEIEAIYLSLIARREPPPLVGPSAGPINQLAGTR